jgi:hypothetical protein
MFWECIMRTILIAAVICVMCGATVSRGAAPETINLGSLLLEMTDFNRLSVFPDPAYKTLQFSSYDHRSTAPYEPGWFANADGGIGAHVPPYQAVLEEPKSGQPGRYLLCDVEGPGVLVRLWSAMLDVNTCGMTEIYLDDAAKPAIAGPSSHVLRRLYALLADGPITTDRNFSNGFDQEDATYFPIPFARRLRVVFIGNVKNNPYFYQINVRRYETGTQVQTFSTDDMKTFAKQIERTRLGLLGDLPDPEPGLVERSFSTTLAPGARAQLVYLKGPARVEKFQCHPEAGDLWTATRQVVLETWFDESSLPQISSPMGDFFGTGPGITPYKVLPFTVEPDRRMTCRFVMPFARSANFELVNYSDQEVKVDGLISSRPISETSQPLMHFHAHWRINHDLFADDFRFIRDMHYIKLDGGQGVFVGDATMIRNPIGYFGSLIWWGEGDEKIWVDDDECPSWFGTGTEDYYNYSWGQPFLFDHAYCAQPLATGPGPRGFIANNRFHFMDAIPFRKRFDFDMELFPQSKAKGFSFGRIVYYYASTKVRDDNIPISQLDVQGGLEFPTYGKVPFAGWNAGCTVFQAEDIFPIVGKKVTLLENVKYAGKKAILFSPSRKGDSISGEFDTSKAGRYLVCWIGTLSPEAGNVETVIDGQQIGGTICLYTPHLEMLRDYQVGQVELDAGHHVLEIRSAGAEPSSKGALIGLDLMFLVPSS